jgi:hypothetical protein
MRGTSPFAMRSPCVAHLIKDCTAMTIVMLQPLVALIAGILILLMPRILNYIVALYLIIVGVIGLAQMAA